MLLWLFALLAAEALMVGLVVIDPETDRDDVIEFVILAAFGAVAALLQGYIIGESSTVVIGVGVLAILGGIIGSGFRLAVAAWGPWWRKLLVVVGLAAATTVSFLIWL